MTGWAGWSVSFVLSCIWTFETVSAFCMLRNKRLRVCSTERDKDRGRDEWNCISCNQKYFEFNIAFQMTSIVFCIYSYLSFGTCTNFSDEKWLENWVSFLFAVCMNIITMEMPSLVEQQLILKHETWNMKHEIVSIIFNVLCSRMQHFPHNNKWFERTF